MFTSAHTYTPALKNTCPSAFHICPGAHPTLPSPTCLGLTCPDNFIPAHSCRRTCALLARAPLRPPGHLHKPPAQVRPHSPIFWHTCLGASGQPPPAASPSSSRRTESRAGWASPSLPPQALRSARAVRRSNLYRTGCCPAGWGRPSSLLTLLREHPPAGHLPLPFLNTSCPPRALAAHLTLTTRSPTRGSSLSSHPCPAASVIFTSCMSSHSFPSPSSVSTYLNNRLYVF